MENWIALEEYLNKEALVETEALLRSNNLMFRVISPENHLHSAMGQATYTPFVIEVQESQYEAAKELISTYDDSLLSAEISVEDYSTEELKAIVLNPDDWHKEFIIKAEEELSKRGSEIAKAEIDAERAEKIRKHQLGTEPPKTVYYFMWFFSILGGYFGIIGGYFYWRGTEKGIDGKRYFTYTKKYRNRGYYMFLIGLISAIMQTFLYIKFR